MSSAAKMVNRAETLVLWYETQPNHATDLRDREIADRLNAIAPHEGWTAGAVLVRQVRRWVDRQKAGDFAETSFGTKRAGLGRTYSHLRNGKAAHMMDAAIGTVSQIQASEHYAKADAERRAREAMKYEAQAREWFALGEYSKSMACRSAAYDMEKKGYLTAKTKTELHLAGLL